MSAGARRWAAVLGVGIAAGVVGIVLTEMLHVVQHLLYGYARGDFLHGAAAASPVRRVIALLLGAALAGTGWLVLRRHADADELSVARAVRERSRLPVVATCADAGLQILAVAAGASLGREGAPRQMAAAIGGWLARHLSPEDQRLLVGCGAGAGLAAMYDVPLAGALFALEVLLGWSWRNAVPAVVSSVIAAATTWPVLGTGPSYLVADTRFDVAVLVWALPFGLVAALAGIGFTSLMRRARTRAPQGVALVPIMVLGFGLLGLVSTRYPELLGNGKSLAQVALNGRLDLVTAIVLVLAKPLATALCLRSGAIGGLLTPALATGAVLGSVCGFGGDGYVLVGAAALLAVTQRAALMSVAIVVELTHAVADLPAMALGVLVAVAAVRAVDRRRPGAQPVLGAPSAGVPGSFRP